MSVHNKYIFALPILCYAGGGQVAIFITTLAVSYLVCCLPCCFLCGGDNNEVKGKLVLSFELIPFLFN